MTSISEVNHELEDFKSFVLGGLTKIYSNLGEQNRADLNADIAILLSNVLELSEQMESKQCY